MSNQSRATSEHDPRLRALFGVDSLITCFAVGPLVSRRSWLPYAALMGACDGGGFLLGTAFHWSVPDTANVVETAVLVGLGVYRIAIAVFAPRHVEGRWIWVLPFVLSIDNITYGLIDHAWSHSVAVQAIHQLLATSLLSVVGLLASAAVMRAIPGLKMVGGRQGFEFRSLAGRLVPDNRDHERAPRVPGSRAAGCAARVYARSHDRAASHDRR
jgi:hypothetical protein